MGACLYFGLGLGWWLVCLGIVIGYYAKLVMMWIVWGIIAINYLV